MTVVQPTSPPPTEAPRGTVSLWAGAIAAPVLWAVQFEITYALVPWICGHGKLFLLHITSAVFLVLAIICFWLCFRDFQFTPSDVKKDEAGPGRAKFLAVLGMFVSGLFTLVIIAQGLAAFFLSPC